MHDHDGNHDEAEPSHREERQSQRKAAGARPEDRTRPWPRPRRFGDRPLVPSITQEGDEGSGQREGAGRGDLHPQQHQLLLQIAGAPSGSVASIAYAAERLGLRHHTVVELVDRSVAEGLLIRTEDPNDGRRVILAITKKGRKILQNLSEYHARELRELGPRLIRSLKDIEDLQKTHQRRPLAAWNTSP